MSYQKIITNGGYKDRITAEPHQRCYEEEELQDDYKVVIL